MKLSWDAMVYMSGQVDGWKLAGLSGSKESGWCFISCLEPLSKWSISRIYPGTFPVKYLYKQPSTLIRFLNDVGLGLQLINPRAGLILRQVGGKRWRATSWNSTKPNVNSCTWDGPMPEKRSAEDWQLRSSPAEQFLGVLVDGRLHSRQQHALAGKKANSTLCYVSKSVSSRPRQLMIHLFAALVSSVGGVAGTPTLIETETVQLKQKCRSCGLGVKLPGLRSDCDHVHTWASDDHLIHTSVQG